MEFADVVRQRRSVRRFEPEAVPREKIIRLLEWAIQAPSAGNVQPWRFLVVSDSNRRKKLAGAAFNQNWMLEAPLIIVVLADLDRAAAAYGQRGVELYALQDTAAAVQNLLLGAVEAGLGACWVGAFSETEAARVLELPQRLRPVAMVPVGVAAGPPAAPLRRRPLEEVVKYDQ